jgi:hypothetical protein
MDMFVSVMRKKKIILSDVKTRVTSSLPKARHLRGPEMQLSLYHQLVSGMIDGKVDIRRLYSSLALDAEGLFSDGFLAEAGMSYSAAGVMSIDTFLGNNNLDVSLVAILLMTEIMAICSNRIIPITGLFESENGNCSHISSRI